MKTGIELIAEERQRQIDIEGWSTEHDATHTNSELAKAAACYAYPYPSEGFIYSYWPFEQKWYKPSELIFHDNNPETHAGRIRELQKAGALIAAEIDRINTIEIENI